MQLVLSLFPGIGLLDMAFEQEGFCVVQSRDWIMGGDIRKAHFPAGKFDGVIGGPPCQAFSELAKLVRANGHQSKFGNLIPEFERSISEARPRWFVMENVKNAPTPAIDGYSVDAQTVSDCDVGGDTIRRRKICFGSNCGLSFRVRQSVRKSVLPPERAITGNSRILTTGERIRNRDRIGTAGGPLPGAGKCTPVSEMAELQGLSKEVVARLPFKTEATRQMLGNGVPLPMGRAIAKAVKEATG